MPSNIVVLGAGVSGLTTALVLARQNRYDITVIAKHMPGDYDIEYASPWAGANFAPVKRPAAATGAKFTSAEGHERTTWPELSSLAKDTPEAGVAFQSWNVPQSLTRPNANQKTALVIYRRAKDAGTAAGSWLPELLNGDAWFKSEMPDFKALPEKDLPAGIDAGVSLTSLCINTTIYLPWLASQCLKYGVVLRRGIVSHISDAAALHHTGQRADVVVNCSGLSSRSLGGVEDSTVYPARGQLVIVRNTPTGPPGPAPTMYSLSGTDDANDETAYVMHRPVGGGTVLGGSLQNNNWESQPDPSLATRIMQRCIDLDRSLVPDGKGIEALSIIRHSVGLRPMRSGGPRIEREIVGGAADAGRVAIVHNYGHGGYGYQTSYGTATVAVRLVDEAVSPQARL